MKKKWKKNYSSTSHANPSLPNPPTQSSHRSSNLLQKNSNLKIPHDEFARVIVTLTHNALNQSPFEISAREKKSEQSTRSTPTHIGATVIGIFILEMYTVG